MNHKRADDLLQELSPLIGGKVGSFNAYIEPPKHGAYNELAEGYKIIIDHENIDDSNLPSIVKTLEREGLKHIKTERVDKVAMMIYEPKKPHSSP